MSTRSPKTIRWLLAALDDAADIVERIAKDSPRAADRFANELIRRVELLADFPYLYPVCPYQRRVRMLAQGKYIAYYTVHREEVVIRAVVHGARLFRAAWLRRED